MDIEKRIKYKKIAVEEKVIRYTEDEVKNLIRKDVESKGYKVKSTSINTDYKNVEDEWGMNSSTMTYIKDVIIKVE